MTELREKKTITKVGGSTLILRFSTTFTRECLLHLNRIKFKGVVNEELEIKRDSQYTYVTIPKDAGLKAGDEVEIIMKNKKKIEIKLKE